MRMDLWGCVINDPETYAEIATELKAGRSIAFGWTDLRSSHLDLLFVLGPTIAGRLQSLHPSIQQSCRLRFVSVMRRGCFALDISSPEGFHPDYLGEKLGVGGATAEALAELVAGVIEQLKA